MTNLVMQPERRHESERLMAEPLDEVRWQAWIAKGRAHDVRVGARAVTAVEWVSIAALVAGTALWSQLAPYAVILRSIIVLGAVIVTFHAIHRKQYELAAVFACCAAIYNPVMPAFSLSGDWQRAVVLATALPFAALLFPLKGAKS